MFDIKQVDKYSFLIQTQQWGSVSFILISTAFLIFAQSRI